MTGSISLNLARRTRELEALAAGKELDVLVVGGGIAGAGVALDAASRGLSVALIERGDLASGTSRWSSKLVHGGLRYLGHGQLGLAWECARERETLMRRVAPHLVRPLPVMIPLTPAWPRVQRGVLRAGVQLGDVLRSAAGTNRAMLPSPRRISAQEARRLVPSLDSQAVESAVLTWDAQLEDDARLVVAVARTAAGHGASVITRCAAERLVPGGAEARDLLTGSDLFVRARQVVSATGAWAAQLSPHVRLAPSKGAHLVVHAGALGRPRAAFSVPVGRQWSRFVFAAPIADDRVLVGLTDNPYTGNDYEAPPVTAADRDFLLTTIGSVLERELTSADVIGEFAGVRPLIAAEGASFDLGRDHALVEDPDNDAISLVGGKLTTYRLMAEDAVNLAVRRLGRSELRCRTRRLPLVGARGAGRSLDAMPARLVQRYGAEALDVAALASADGALLDPVSDGVPTLRAELLFGVLHEGALDASDLLDRRTRIGLVPADRERALEAADEALATAAAGHAPASL